MILAYRFLPYQAMALYPFILVKCDELRNNASLIRHERIHHRQQLELFLVAFYVFYGINYLLNLVKYRSHGKAYMEIIFEREAYAMDKDPNYLKSRKPFAFLDFRGNGSRRAASNY